MQTPIKISIFMLLGAMLLVGCTPPLVKEAMIPEVPLKHEAATPNTIAVSSVTGGRETIQGLDPWIDDASFKEALTASLENSGLFKEVVTKLPGHYSISAEIIAQKMSGAFANTIDFFVHYELVENKTSSLAWKGNYYSHFELSVKDIRNGGERRRRLQEMAVRDNLKQLLQQLESVITLQSGS